MTTNISLVTSIRHPSYLSDMTHWDLWRTVYEGGDEFVYRYLQKFNTRESENEFNNRRSITPIPSFAKAAINTIRNSVFQRMRDILRTDGSVTYTEATAGLSGGVDLRGSNMNVFIGYKALQELCTMGRVGIYVDMPILSGSTLAETHHARPYLYMYPVEDILSWTCSNPFDTSDYSAVLLRDRNVDFGELSKYNFSLPVPLPTGKFERYRLVYINPDTGFVNVIFMNMNGDPIDPSTNIPLISPEPIELELTRIPFVMLDIGESLLKDVSKHQIALLNLGSSDVAYALKSNFPFYTEQRDLRAVGDHLKHASNPDGGGAAGKQGSSDNNINIGATQGRAYDLKADRPAFINPSSEPLETSLKLQLKLEGDIRKLVNLALADKARSLSKEDLEMDNEGVEAGLAFIGSILENGERKIAEHWAAYEERRIDRRKIPVIKYPNRYTLKSDQSRIEESTKLATLMSKVPGRTIKRELAKCIVSTLLSGKVGVDTLEKIDKEVDTADYTTSDPQTIISSREAGLVSEQVASMALGFNENEYLRAREDHMERIIRIATAQGKGQGTGAEVEAAPAEGEIENPAARGLPDLSSDPASESEEERQEATDTTLKEDIKKPVRGSGKGLE